MADQAFIAAHPRGESRFVLVDHDLKNWQAVIPKDDPSLKRELLRSFLNYLGVEQKA